MPQSQVAQVARGQVGVLLDPQNPRCPNNIAAANFEMNRIAREHASQRKPTPAVETRFDAFATGPKLPRRIRIHDRNMSRAHPDSPHRTIAERSESLDAGKYPYFGRSMVAWIADSRF